VRLTIPQMQAAAREGAFIEFVYGATLGTNPVVTMKEYADAIRAVGPNSCIVATDFGAVQTPPEPQRPLEPQGLLDFMMALRKEGISVADINLMTKTNPALALGLQP
jgi:microsomal dipeptidase-like Zn-dependent dipeptidase